MQRQLYPTELIDSSIEQHLTRHSTRSQAIHSTIIVGPCAAGVSLPRVRVEPLRERLEMGRAQLEQARSLVGGLELLTSTESPLVVGSWEVPGATGCALPASRRRAFSASESGA